MSVSYATAKLGGCDYIPVMGVDGGRSGVQVDAERPAWRPRFGHGSSGIASDCSALGARLCAALSERRQPDLFPGDRHPFWLLGAAAATTRQGLSPQTALDAAARAALCAGGQAHETPAHCRGEAPGRSRHKSGGGSGLIRPWLADQYVIRGEA